LPYINKYGDLEIFEGHSVTLFSKPAFMIKITATNLNQVITGAIIAHYPVDGEPQEQFEEGDNTISWTVMAKSGSGYKLATHFVGTSTHAQDLVPDAKLSDGHWWMYEEIDLQHNSEGL